MAIPDEDRGPAWLRNWQYIEADIQAMDDFAKKLRAEVETNYVSHLSPIMQTAETKLPDVDPRFGELFDLLDTHHQAHSASTHQVRDYANRSAGMAAAASKISANYGEADAFAQASVDRVQKALGESGVAQPGAPGAGEHGAAPPNTGDPGGVTIPTTEVY